MKNNKITMLLAVAAVVTLLVPVSNTSIFKTSHVKAETTDVAKALQPNVASQENDLQKLKEVNNSKCKVNVALNENADLSKLKISVDSKMNIKIEGIDSSCFNISNSFESGYNEGQPKTLCLNLSSCKNVDKDLISALLTYDVPMSDGSTKTFALNSVYNSETGAIAIKVDKQGSFKTTVRPKTEAIKVADNGEVKVITAEGEVPFTPENEAKALIATKNSNGTVTLLPPSKVTTSSNSSTSSSSKKHHSSSSSSSSSSNSTATSEIPATTEVPAVTSEAPATTEPPAATTEPPAATTEPPAATTEPPAATTEPPAVTTEPPVATTEPPAVTSEAPAVTSEAPAVTSEAPTTSEAPVATS